MTLRVMPDARNEKDRRGEIHLFGLLFGLVAW